MTNTEAFQKYFDDVIAYLRDDAKSKSQKIPEYFRSVVGEEVSILFGASYFKYLVFGRGPGKFPPPDKMMKVVEDNPNMFEEARRVWNDITKKGLAFIIGRKIAKEGTMIWRGDKPGIDFVGALEKNKPDLLKTLVRNEAIKVRTILHEA